MFAENHQKIGYGVQAYFQNLNFVFYNDSKTAP